MNDRLSDLLEEVADDGGRPLGFTVADVAARGHAVRRRRTAWGAAGAAGAVAAVTVAALAWSAVPDGPRADQAPPAGSVTVAPDTTQPSPDPAPTGAPAYVPPTPGVGWTGPNTPMTAQDATVMSRCQEVEPALQGWRFDAQVTDARGTTATFVSDDHTEWRACTLGTPVDAVSDAWPLDTRPVPDPWDVPDSGVELASTCPKEADPGCDERLYTATFPLRAGVADVSVETPRGVVADVSLGVATYVVRFVESAVPSSVPPVVATLRDASGATILTYDYNAALR